MAQAPVFSAHKAWSCAFHQDGLYLILRGQHTRGKFMEESIVGIFLAHGCCHKDSVYDICL